MLLRNKIKSNDVYETDQKVVRQGAGGTVLFFIIVMDSGSLNRSCARALTIAWLHMIVHVHLQQHEKIIVIHTIMIMLFLSAPLYLNLSYADSTTQQGNGFGDSLMRFTCANGQRPFGGSLINEIITGSSGFIVP
jgi:hypothetical protein